MANALTLFDNVPQLPAEVAQFFDDAANIVPKETVPSLSYEGKNWTISLNGEKKTLKRKTADGDEEPITVMRAVILDYSKRRGRNYYEGAYDSSKPGMPVCWSDDGLTPSTHVKEKKADACAKCPLSVKGSKVTEQGKAIAACSEHRMIVVVPYPHFDFEPLRMKLAITSDYDGQSPDLQAQGWFAFKNYTDLLRTRGVQHTAMLVTKMKFDMSVPYPKVIFSADKWLDPGELAKVVPVVKDERVQKLISGSWTPNGVDGTITSKPDDGDDEGDAPAPAVAPPPPPKPAPTLASTTAPKPALSTGETRLARLTAQVDEDDESHGDVAPVTATPTKKAAPKAAPAKAPVKPKATNGAAPPASGGDDDLDSLIADWA
jgi:hypothetical protein